VLKRLNISAELFLF